MFLLLLIYSNPLPSTATLLVLPPSLLLLLQEITIMNTPQGYILDAMKSYWWTSYHLFLINLKGNYIFLYFISALLISFINFYNPI